MKFVSAIIFLASISSVLAGKKKNDSFGKEPLNKKCTQIPVHQQVGKTRTEYRTEVFDCSYVETSEECHPVSETIPKTCHMTDYKIETYDCSETTFDTHCNQLHTKGRRLGPKYNEKAPVQPSVQCHQVPTRVAKQCTRQVPLLKAYPCDEVIMRKECHPVERKVQKQCTRQVPVPVPFTETITTFRSECHEVPLPTKHT